MDTVESAVKGAKGGKKAWDKLEKDGTIQAKTIATVATTGFEKNILITNLVKK